MKDTPLPPAPPVDGSTKTVRTFKKRADAEKAVAVLAKANIAATILDLAVPPGSQQRVGEGAVRLVVDTEQANLATKLLLEHAKEVQVAQALRQEAVTSGRRPTRMRPVRQGRFGAAFILLVALGFVGVASLFVVKAFFRQKAPPVEPPVDREYFEDTNHDGKVDYRRYVNKLGYPAREELDVNFDGKWDLRVSFSGGKLYRRSVDLDGNGIYDEDTYYNAEARPVYSQYQKDAAGAITRRTFYQEVSKFEAPESQEVLDSVANLPDNQMLPVRILHDDDADGNFDREQTFDITGKVIQERALEKGAPENGPVPFE